MRFAPALCLLVASSAQANWRSAPDRTEVPLNQARLGVIAGPRVGWTSSAGFGSPSLEFELWGIHGLYVRGLGSGRQGVGLFLQGRSMAGRPAIAGGVAAAAWQPMKNYPFNLGLVGELGVAQRFGEPGEPLRFHFGGVVDVAFVGLGLHLLAAPPPEPLYAGWGLTLRFQFPFAF